MQYLQEAAAAKSFINISGEAWQRVGLSAAAGMLGGATAVGVGKFAVVGTRLVTGMGANAFISAGQKAATTALQEGRAATGEELAAAGGLGALGGLAGGIIGEAVREPAIQLAKSAPLYVRVGAWAIDRTTASAKTGA